MRTGIGYDVHRLMPGRELVLGGIKIPFEKGLDGHSDADVLIHALCDAMLGAAGLGDIGGLFPDSDPRYRGIDSSYFLRETHRLLLEKGFVVQNVDAVILAEQPRVAPYRSAMIRHLAQTLQIVSERINIKATTTEGLGFVGEGKGIGAMCVVLLAKRRRRSRIDRTDDEPPGAGYE